MAAKQHRKPAQPWQSKIVGYGEERVDQIVGNARNVRLHPREQQAALTGSLHEVGIVQNVIINKRTAAEWGRDQGIETLLDGHARVQIALSEGQETLPVTYVDLTPKEEDLALLAFDGTTAMAAWDKDKLAELLADVQTEDAGLQGLLDELAKEAGVGAGGDGSDPAPQLDRAEELREQWGVELGQVWEIPSKSVPGKAHRVVCGDSTKAADVARLMGGEKAALCHADPPYGMGKEAEGIANDNLYRDKLDAFQLAWWKACRPVLEDNASAYLWGNAEDLWRLWWKAGLSAMERLTFRNEIVWDKGSGQGMGDDTHRQYPTASERCLLFMLGEQGINVNADNYWEGWEPVRAKLAADCEKMGWGADDIKRICGVGMYSHWFTKSQWEFITEEHYRKLQAAAREHDAFKREYDELKREYDELKREYDELKREYDELKREFYATRAYFDNAHDNMTDVWHFGRVVGEERWEHATPKPVDLVARCVKSSSPEGAAVLDPFIGSGTTLVACENLGRVGFGMELEAKYVAVALQRLADMGLTPALQEAG